jgi:hypothetical protein
VIVSRKTSGFVSAKFDGASASMYWRVKKSTFFFVCSASPRRCRPVVQPARRDQVRLLDVVEQEMLLPVFVLEALVAFGRLGDRLGRRADHSQHRRLPQAHVLPPQIELCFGESIWIRQHLCCELEKRFADAQLVGEHRPWAVRIPRGELAHQLRAFVGGSASDSARASGIVLIRAGGCFGDGRCGHRSPQANRCTT